MTSGQIERYYNLKKEYTQETDDDVCLMNLIDKNMKCATKYNNRELLTRINNSIFGGNEEIKYRSQTQMKMESQLVNLMEILVATKETLSETQRLETIKKLLGTMADEESNFLFYIKLALVALTFIPATILNLVCTAGFLASALSANPVFMVITAAATVASFVIGAAIIAKLYALVTMSHEQKKLSGELKTALTNRYLQTNVKNQEAENQNTSLTAEVKEYDDPTDNECLFEKECQNNGSISI